MQNVLTVLITILLFTLCGCATKGAYPEKDISMMLNLIENYSSHNKDGGVFIIRDLHHDPNTLAVWTDPATGTRYAYMMVEGGAKIDPGLCFPEDAIRGIEASWNTTGTLDFHRLVWSNLGTKNTTGKCPKGTRGFISSEFGRIRFPFIISQRYDPRTNKITHYWYVNTDSSGETCKASTCISYEGLLKKFFK